MVAIFNVGPTEWIVILVIALLLFGRRLPEVMKNLGKGIVEFKRGVRGIEDQVEEESTRPPVSPPQKAVGASPQTPRYEAGASAPAADSDHASH